MEADVLQINLEFKISEGPVSLLGQYINTFTWDTYEEKSSPNAYYYILPQCSLCLLNL